MTSIRKELSVLLCLTLLLQPVASLAGPIAARSGGPTIEQTANGLPLVQIKRPGASGLSHNRYERFDIDRRGLILNNARTLTQTELAGYVDGNPNLSSSTARIILNEVTGSQRSWLNGFAEVAGDRAEVVIANPNGATCDGCGFINTSRALLTTGRPHLNLSGGLDKLEVSGGDLDIRGAGLQGGAARVDLLARSIRVNGAIHSGELNLIAGRNRVGYADLDIELLQEGNATPQLAIDVGQLGGMYAGRIRLLGTEAGVGVASYGDIAASGSELVIDNSGHLLLAGHLQSDGQLGIEADSLTMTGDLYAGTNGSINSRGATDLTGQIRTDGPMHLESGDLTVTGSISAGGSLNVVSARTQQITGLIHAAGDMSLVNTQLSNSGEIYASGNLSVDSAGELSNQGILASGADLSLRAEALDHSGVLAAGIDSTGQPATEGSILAEVTDTVTLAGEILTTDDLEIQGRDLHLQGSKLTTSGSTALTASNRIDIDASSSLDSGAATGLQGHQIANAGTLRTGTDLDLRATGSISNRLGLLVAGDDVKLNATGLDNRDGQILGTTIDALLGGDLLNQLGTLQAIDHLGIAGQGLDNRQGRLEVGGPTGTLRLATQQLDNRNGRIVNLGSGETTLQAEVIDNSGIEAIISGGGSTRLEVRNLDNSSGRILADDSLEIEAGALLNNHDGLLFSQGDLNLNGGADLDNNGGSIGARGDLTITGADLDNQAGLLAADDRLDLQGQTLQGAGTILAGTSGHITLTGDYLHEAGSLIEGQQFDLTVGGRLTNAGILNTTGAMNLAGRQLLNQADGLIRAAQLDIQATERIDNHGRLEGDSLQATTETLANQGTLLGNRLTITASSLENRGAAAIIAATETLELRTDRLSNRDQATLFSLEDLTITGRDGLSPALSILNEGSLIEAGRDLVIRAEQIDNRRAEVTIATDLIATSSDTLGLYQGYQETVLVEDCSMAGDSNDCDLVPGTTTGYSEQSRTVAIADIRVHDPTRNYVEFVGMVTGIEDQTTCTDWEGFTSCTTRPVLVDRPQLIKAWYDSYATGGGQATISYYPDYDPTRDIHPESVLHVVLVAKGEPVGHRETSRTVTTRTWQDRFSLVSPEAKIIAGRDLDLTVSGRLLNNASLISAGQDVDINGTLFNAGSVTAAELINRGYDLQQRTRTETVSIVEWHDSCGWFEDHCGDNVVPYPWVPQEQLQVIDSLTASIQAGNNLSVYTGSLANTTVTTTANPLTGSTPGSVTPIDIPQPTSVSGPSLTVPANGLYRMQPGPGGSYLVETDPRFTDYGQFISSDYMLARLGLDPEGTMKRLGDGFYEQRLVMQQLADEPRPTTGGWQTGAVRYQQLMDAGIAAAERLNLTAGIALTEAQVAALTHDIVWLVEQQVALPDGKTEPVLVPLLYLARLQPGDLKPSGALMAAGSMEILALEDIDNRGNLTATDRLFLDAEDIRNSGLIASGGDLSLAATREIRNLSGRLAGRNVSLSAGGDIRLETETREIRESLGGIVAGNTLVGETASVRAEETLSMNAGGNLQLHGAEVASGGDARITASRDLGVDSVATHESLQIEEKRLAYAGEKLHHQTSTVTAGGRLDLASGEDIRLTGADIRSGSDLSLIAGGDISITEATDYETEHLEGRGKKIKLDSDRLDETTRGSQLTAGGNLLVASASTADDAVSIRGSNLSAGQNGTLQIATAGGVQITEARERHDSYYRKEKDGSSLLTRKSSLTEVEEKADLAVGSQLSGHDVQVSGDRGVLIQGSALTATGDVALQAAGGDVTLTAADDIQSSHYQKKKADIISKRSLTTRNDSKELVSTIVDAGQDLAIIAGTDADGSIAIHASHLQAGKDVYLQSGSGTTDGDIELVAGTSESLEFAEKKKSGIGIWADSDSLSFYREREKKDGVRRQTSEASTISAGGDVAALASRDIDLLGSRIEGDNITLISGRDTNLIHDQHHLAEEHLKKESDLGVSFSSDQDSLSFFAGLEKTREESDEALEMVAASELRARGDVTIDADASIVQMGSDLMAGGDIRLTAGEEIRTLVGYNIREAHYLQESMRLGYTLKVQHGIGNAWNRTADITDSDNLVTGASRWLRAIDAVDNTQPSVSAHIGASGNKRDNSELSSSARASAIVAENNINLQAEKDITNEATFLSAGQDIVFNAENIHFTTAQQTSQRSEKDESFRVGLNASASQSSATLSVGGQKADSDYDMSRHADAGGSLASGQDILINASEDIVLDAVQADSGRNMTISAGKNLQVRAGHENYSSQFDASNYGGEIGLGYGIAATGPDLGLYGSVNAGRQDLHRNGAGHQNSTFTADDTLKIQTGMDAKIAGANLEADHVIADIGGDLTVSSAINTGEADGDQWNAGLTVGTGGFGFSGGLGETDGHTNWIDDQSTIRGHQEIDIVVGQHTQLDHALIIADNDNLKLETDTFGFNDFMGEDTETSHDLGGGLSIGDGRSSTGEEAGSGTFEPDLGDWSIEGNYSDKDRHQVVQATVGEGTIIVRQDEHTGNDSTEGLNRDENAAYQITKDEKSEYELYASENSLKDLNLPAHINRAIENYAAQAGVLIHRLFPDGLTPQQQQQFHQAALSNDPEKLNALIADFKQRGLTDSELQAVRDFVHRNIDQTAMITSLSEAAKQKVLIQVGVYIDGTGNNKFKDLSDGKETNVARLFELYRGNKKRYIQGVGTENLFSLIWGGLTGYGSQKKVEESISFLSEAYKDGTKTGPKFLVIDSAGFSRGSAANLTLANEIDLNGISGIPKDFIIHRSVVLFDTVASTGIPGNNIDWGHKYQIPKSVGVVIHATADNEYRDLFDLQSAIYSDGTAPPNVIEKGFAGDHSGTGGGHKPGSQGKSNKLSLIPLEWAHSHALKYDVPYSTIPAKYQPTQGLKKLYTDYQFAKDNYDKNPSTINKMKYSLAFDALREDYIHNMLPLWKKIPPFEDKSRTVYYPTKKDN